jgi:3-methyladenine DNA glycosylase/8-oxoguanine DNA glycosylase
MTIDTKAAIKYFKTIDPVMAQVVERALTAERPIAIPTQKPTDAYFSSIVTSIISQQISTKAADAIRGRVVTLLGTVTPETVTAVDFMTLKQCGLSEKKTTYIKQNAELWHTLPISSLTTMSDDDIIKELTKLYGIGRWTVEMFLMFSLARPDVFSYGDLGLMKSLYRHYNFKPHYTRKIRQTVDSWSPHRTVASLALWHTIDNGPVLL